MQAVGQPNVDIQCQRLLLELADGTFQQRHRMILKCCEKGFVQCYRILEKHALIVGFLTEKQPVADDAPIAETVTSPPASVGGRPEKSDMAGGNPSRLITKRSSRLTPYGKAHAAHPIAHGSTKLDLPALRPDRLRLQIYHNNAGAGAIGNTYQLGRTGTAFQSTRFNQQCDVVAALFPGCIVNKPFVRKSR